MMFWRGQRFISDDENEISKMNNSIQFLLPDEDIILNSKRHGLLLCLCGSCVQFQGLSTSYLDVCMLMLWQMRLISGLSTSCLHVWWSANFTARSIDSIHRLAQHILFLLISQKVIQSQQYVSDDWQHYYLLCLAILLYE